MFEIEFYIKGKHSYFILEMPCANILLTYYWKIDTNNVNIVKILGLPYSTNNIFWHTSNYCHHSKQMIEQEIANRSMSSNTICLN